MYRFNSFLLGRLAAAFVAAVILASSPIVAEEIPFRANGTDEVTAFQGNRIEGINVGKASPGGPFVGVWSATVKGFSVSGIEFWDFGAGHSVTWTWEVSEMPDNVSAGVYVIVAGTGLFEGATGRADLVRIGNGDGTGNWEMEGSIHLR